MNAVKRAAAAVLCALILLCAVTGLACAETAYGDGIYTAALSFTGGSGRIVWDSPVQITVQDGAIYADLVMRKPGGATPSVEWMECGGVRYEAQVDTDAGTCTFCGVLLTHLGDIPVRANTTAMSEEYVVEYTLHIDETTISRAEAEDTAGRGGRSPAAMAVIAMGAAVVAGGVYVLARRRGGKSDAR